MMIFFALIALVATAAFGQEPAVMVEQQSFLSQLASGEFLGKVLAVMVAVQIVLYGLAEGLTRLSVYTETNFDNKVAAWISQAAWLLGSLLGKFGYSVPKLVLEEKAKKIAPMKSGEG